MRDPFVIVLLLTFGAVGEGRAQITDPIPARIEKRGLMVEIRDVARLPLNPRDASPRSGREPGGLARVSFVRELSDGRRFANDSRGFLYLLEGGDRPTLYLDFRSRLPVRALQPAGERLYRIRTSTRNSLATDSSTPSHASMRRATPPFPTSSRRASRRPTSPTTTSSPSGARRTRAQAGSRAPGASCSVWPTSSRT